MKSRKIVQFGGREVLVEELELKVKDIWREEGRLQKDLKSLNLYIKIEENKCYYVINDTVSGSFELIA